jgi:WD40 repeat protein
MEMDYNGLILATANDKGTHIRLHNLLDKTLIYECKRGKDKAIINYISFDMDYNYVGVTSSKGTIHIWKLDEFIEKEKKDNDIIYSLKKRNSNGYKTELSFAKIKFQKPCIFCFKKNQIIIITQDEKYYLSTLDKKGGYYNFNELKDFYKSNKKEK